tara:strand:- start:5598 stop:7034 length:1437 start_codon:yes stop_codon:yes gene_type:complete
LNIVWLKRDIRTIDHEPFFWAENQKEDYIIVYILEPKLISHTDTSMRHLHFIYNSILDVNSELKKFNRQVNIFFASGENVFDYLTTKYQVSNVFSYKESGVNLSWQRDKKVLKTLNRNRVKWKQFDNQGVLRGIKDRVGWDKNWFSYINSSLVKNKFSKTSFKIEKSIYDFTIEKIPELKIYPKEFQPAGQEFAIKYLNSFISERGKNYGKNISYPEKSRISCGRLSTYLSWGNLSLRYVYQLVKKSDTYKFHKRSFDTFLARLKWRSHFIQKFEVDCSYEFNCINSGYEKMIYENNDEYLDKWKKGETGFPIVDASMRCLINNGWLNFRMRAMLVSFLCHHLHQDWRRGVYHMAKLFLDYEPGIHYTQFQMQAGVTGINSIRIYNPIKQSIEKDPDAIFIKKWIPELKEVPKELIHKPWELSQIDLIDKKEVKKYAKPIVDVKLNNNKTKNQLWQLKRNIFVKHESSKILRIHVRPK